MINQNGLGRFAPESSLWEYSERAYANPDVERLALELQDNYHANANIVLWCCWMHSENINIAAALLEHVLLKIDTVNQQTVVKIREIRKLMQDSGSFTKVQAQSVKKHLLSAELMVERVLIHRLQDLTCRFLESHEYQCFAEGEEMLDLSHYLRSIGVDGAAKVAALLVSLCDRTNKAEMQEVS